jgi:hypothetical protein
VGKFIKDFKIPYPKTLKTLIQKIKALLSAIWAPIFEKIRKFVTEEKYATNLFENLINKTWGASKILGKQNLLNLNGFDKDNKAYILDSKNQVIFL